MTAALIGDRAKETTTTQGTGTYSLAGAAAGFFSLVQAAQRISGDNVGPWLVEVAVTDGVDLEHGFYTLTDATPDTLARTTILRSTNGNAAVNWGSGTRNVFLSPGASRMMTLPGMADATALTIATGAISPRYGQHIVDTESAAASDDLDTINLTNIPQEGAWLLLSPASAARVVNVRHNQGTTGKILTRDAATVVLDATKKYLLLRRVGTTWEEVARFGFDAELAAVNSFTKLQKWKKGADVASAATLTLGDDGNYFDITGTTGITAIASKGAGTTVRLHFDGACLLTHHATNLVLPGAANYTTAGGDELEFTEYESGWRCTGYALASGRAMAGGIATQAEMEAASSVLVAVPPGRLQNHPSAAKSWVQLNGTGTISITKSYNTSSLVDNGTADYSVNLSVANSAAEGALLAGADYNALPWPQVWGAVWVSASQYRIRASNTSSGVVADMAAVNGAVFGDQ